jgi:hypothetical protein
VAWGSTTVTEDIPTTATTLAAGDTIDTIIKFFSKTKSPNENMLVELGNVRKIVCREMAFFNNPLVDEATKKKRLNFLFVKDLLDGVNGMILNHKDRRDNESVSQVSLHYKVLASLLLFVSSFGMLYYVFLFAMQQTASRQSAWFTSFQVWLVFEIFVTSTGTVLIEHVFVPLMCMKDVQRVKEKIVSDILIFQKRLKDEGRRRAIGKALHAVPSGSANNNSNASTGTSDSLNSFNAAEFLYPSHRIAQLFPKYSESELILQYRTVWPKKSFQQNGETKSIKKKYDKRFAFVTSTITRVGMFALTSVIQLPPSLQDMGLQVVILTTFGFLLKLHVDLFHIYPLLAFLPTFLVAILVHVSVSGSKPRSLSLTYPLASSKKEEEDEAEEERKQREQKEENVEESEENHGLGEVKATLESKDDPSNQLTEGGEADDHLTPLNQPHLRDLTSRNSHSYQDLLAAKEWLESFQLELEDDDSDSEGVLSLRSWFPNNESQSSSSSSSSEGFWGSSSDSQSPQAQGLVWENETVSAGSGRFLSFSPNVFSDSGSLLWESPSSD